MIAAAALTLVAGCAVEPNGFEKIRELDILPRSPVHVQQERTASGSRLRSTIFAGEEQGALAASQPVATPTGDAYDLNFDNIPISAVAKIVLGDILRLGYVIDPRVEGTVTIATARPIPKSQILFVLENALRMNGVALVRDAAGYRLTPLSEAAAGGRLDRGASVEPGHGLSVVALRYVSAPTLMKLIDSFASKPGAVRVDASRNLILVQGSGSDRRSVVDLVTSFDADWMRGQSVGIFPLQNGAPETIIAELEKILDSGEGGMGHGVVKLQPVARMNAVLAVSRRPELLRRVEVWIRRLDHAETARAGVHVYHLKYGEARSIARVLNDIFLGGTGPDAGDPLAPGSGSSTATSAANRLSAGGLTQQALIASSRTTAGGTQTGVVTAVAPAATTIEDRAGGLFEPRSTAPPTSGAVLQGVRISADRTNNSVLVYASQEQYAIIERALHKLDKPQTQVAIHATVAEVTLNDSLNYGVQFYLESQNLGLRPGRGSVLNTASQVATQTLINRVFPGFNLLIGSENRPNLVIDALHGITDVKVLSNPSLVVVDNQVATLQVGDEVPIATGSATVLTANNTIVNTIDYRNTGIILRVIPRVSANGTIRLDIEQEISNVSPTPTAGTLTPTISQRKVRSSVSVASGQTVLLAGLIQERQSGSRQGIPILDQIPVFGEAFTNQRNKDIQRTELILFIRPQIIRDSVDAHFVAEELRSKLRGTIDNGLGPYPRN